MSRTTRAILRSVGPQYRAAIQHGVVKPHRIIGETGCEQGVVLYLSVNRTAVG